MNKNNWTPVWIISVVLELIAIFAIIWGIIYQVEHKVPFGSIIVTIGCALALVGGFLMSKVIVVLRKKGGEQSMAKYRKKRGSDTWHWCRNCKNWPTEDYTERDSRPGSDLCNECKAKERTGDCTA